MKKTLIHIDEDKCIGCGACANACHQGAIQIVDGKAKLVSPDHCDGLGRCLPHCPVDAIRLEEREAGTPSPRLAPGHAHGGGGCPGQRIMQFDKPAGSGNANSESELRQWPLQLHLVPVNAPYWNGADLLVAADCTAFAAGDFHARLLRGKRLVIACPKLDDTAPYLDKLTAILRENDICSLTVAFMEVPCCRGLLQLAEKALALCGKEIPFHKLEVSLQGSVQTFQS